MAGEIKDVKKVVLAYSGGLDTSIILKWLQTNYGCEVVTFTADLGQGEELEPARQKALLLGIKPEHIFIEDLREEFVRDYVFPMFRANAQYEGLYLLGTSIARPLIAKKQIEIARRTGADAVAHGATGKGNDQVRFELSYYALEPDIKVIAPWREWALTSRSALIAFAEQNQIPIAKDKRGEAPFSVDANLLHVSSEGKVLEDPAQEVPDYVYSRTLNPEDAPNEPEYVEIDFARGDATAVNGTPLSPAALLAHLNGLGRAHLPVGRPGLAVCVDAGAYDGGAIVVRQGQETIEPRAGGISVLEVDRVEDRSPTDPLQRRLGHGRFGRVDDEGDGRLGREAPCHLCHIAYAVGTGVVDAHVQQMRPLARLVTRHRDRRLPITGQHGVAEALRAVGVRALPDHEEGQLLFEGRRCIQRCSRRLVHRRAASRLQVRASPDDFGEMLRGRAAAPADDRGPELTDEHRQVLGERVRSQVVVHLPVDDRGQACVRQRRNGRTRLL